MELLKEDIERIVLHLPKDLRDIIKNERYAGTAVGGGFIRDTILGEKPRDIDVFSSSPDKAHRAADELVEVRLEANARKIVTDNAVTIVSENFLPVQFITRWTYDKLEKVVESFDFTVVQAIVFITYHPFEDVLCDKEDMEQVWTSYASERFYMDLASRRLHYTSPVRLEEAGGSILRMVKMLKRGYSVSPDSVAAVCTRLFKAIDLDAWNGEVDGEEQEERQVKIVMGLLREVDPNVLETVLKDRVRGL